MPLSVVQYGRTLRGDIPNSGGRELEGTLNMAGLGNVMDHGYSNQSTVGTNYFYFVTWNAEKLHASGILVYGQSSEPHEAYYSDQTKLFLRGKLINPSFERSRKSSSTTSEHGHVSLFRPDSSLVQPITCPDLPDELFRSGTEKLHVF